MMRKPLLSAVAAALAAGAFLPVTGARAAGADATADPGIGSAIAQTWKVDPKAGGLSIGVAFGQALAGHQNYVAKAASQAINLGALGTSLGAPQCDGSPPSVPPDQQPDALQVDSRDDGADKGKTENEDFQGHMAPGYLPFTKFAMAKDTPFGEATTTTAPVTIPGVLDMSAGLAHSESGIVDGVRQAKSTVDIASLNLANVVVLKGLHWEALYQSSGKDDVTGAFTIGSATIGGVAVPTSSPSDVLAMANAVLNQLGLQLVPGGTYKAGGVQFVEPLSVEVVPNSKRDTAAGTVYGYVQPGQQQLFDGLYTKGSCKFANIFTIYDIVLGSVTGAGSFAIQLGGVQASSAPLPANDFNLGAPGYETIGGETPPVITTPVQTTYVPGSTTPGSQGSAPTSSPRPGRRVIAMAPVQPAAASFKGARGGALAAVGLVTLALLAMAAEGDRRKMRRAQQINQEAQQ